MQYTIIIFSFQDIQTNVERSMQSLMSIGHRMLDMITRSPRLLLPASDPASQPPPSQPSQAHTGSGEHFPDFKHCDCHFGKSHATLDCNKSTQLHRNGRGFLEMIRIYFKGSGSISPTQFRPYHESPDLAPGLTGLVTNDLESYGAPAAEVVTSYQQGYGAPAAPALDNYGSPQAPAAPVPSTRSGIIQ